MPAETVAAVMGCSVEKLQAQFAHELEHGRAIIRAEVLFRFDAAGVSGSVSANRSLESISALQPRRGRVGKKEAAEIAALDAGVGTPWEELIPSLRRRGTSGAD
jgi:hypothetical protein